MAPRNDGSLSVGDRIANLERSVGELRDRMRKLELAWAKAAVVIVTANALVVFALRALWS